MPGRHAGVVMGLIGWLTEKSANTREPSHRDLAPLVVPRDQDSATELVRRAVAALPLWRVESESPGELRLTRRTGLWGFVDQVSVTLKPAGPGTMIHAASESRGCGGFGRNRRNIIELWAAVRAAGRDLSK